MELYYAEGPAIVREIKARGHKIFLDLKLHDIPNTVKKAMSVLRNLDVDITNLHAAGTTAMMKAALEGLTREDSTVPTDRRDPADLHRSGGHGVRPAHSRNPLTKWSCTTPRPRKTRVWTAWSALLWKRGRCMSAAVSTFSP